MTVIQFAILGLYAASAYTLLAQGLVLTYRGSAVVNFAQGALAMASAFLYYQLHEEDHWAFAPALVVTLVFGLVLGALIYLVVMRPLRRAAAVSKAVATLGVLILLEGLAELRYGENPKEVTVPLPSQVYTIDGVEVPLNVVVLLAIAAAVTLLLWWASSRTTLGLALRGNAENARAVAALGWSSDRLGLVTWSVGSVLGALAGVLIAPSIGISVTDMPALVVPVLAAVLIGRFESFGLTFASCVVIGIVQSEIGRYWHLTGAAEAVPFLLLIAYLVIRRDKLTVRTQIAERLPVLGSGRTHWPFTIAAIIASIAIVRVWGSPDLLSGLTISLGWAVVILSIVVLLGYTGQLSLAQYTIGGIGALVAAQLSSHGVPFIVCFIAGVLFCSVIGVVFGVPALRTRGINLAIITLGLAVAAVALVFNNGSLTGGFVGITVRSPTLFGLSVDPILHPGRYALMSYAVFLLAAIAVANIRRGTAGSRLIATRTNERAAAALGVNVYQAKIFAFSSAAMLAAAGVTLIAFTNPVISFENNYDPLTSILAVGYGIVGGVGYVAGAPIGATLPQGGFGNWILNTAAPSASPVWLTIISGVALLLNIVLQPDGLARANLALLAVGWGKVQSRLRYPRTRKGRAVGQETPSRPAPLDLPHEMLSVEDVSVRFGGTDAVRDLSFSIPPGHLVGLIGPNGAGKSTVIDVISGFVTPRSGHVRLGEMSLDELPPHRRARAGIGRSFQSLELFDTATVRENLQVACDDARARRFLFDPFWPRATRLTPQAMLAIDEFRLGDDLDRVVRDLPYGRRRLVAVARAAAASRLLLLDEPAAGLSSEETNELREVVRRFAKDWGFGVLVVEHDMNFVLNLCDRVVVLDFGEKIAEGAPAEIVKDERVIAAYLGQSETEEGMPPVSRR